MRGHSPSHSPTAITPQMSASVWDFCEPRRGRLGDITSRQDRPRVAGFCGEQIVPAGMDLRPCTALTDRRKWNKRKTADQAFVATSGRTGRLRDGEWLGKEEKSEHQVFATYCRWTDGRSQMTSVLSKKKNCGPGFCCNTGRTGRFRHGEGLGKEEKCECRDFVAYRRWIRWEPADDRCFVKEETLRTRLLWQDAGGRRDFGMVRVGRKKKASDQGVCHISSLDPMTARR